MPSPTDRELGGRNGDTLSAEGRAATLCLHPVRRWAIAAASAGSVTSRDLFREFPFLGMSAAGKTLKNLERSGVLKLAQSRQGAARADCDIYELADITDLCALRDWLSNVLKEQTP